MPNIKEGGYSEAGELLKSLIEQSSFQNKLLAAILERLEVSVCNLEKISKQTCLTLNEVHIQTGLQKSVKEALDFLILMQKELHPSELQHVEQLEKLKLELLKCCPKEEKEKPICLYDPCDTGSQYRPKYRDSHTASAKPQKTEGAPYKPAPMKDDTDEMNEVEAPDVPIGKFKGFIIPQKGSTPKEMGAADGAPDPVVFNKYTNTTVSSPVSNTAADISGADSNNVVMMSGNWYIDYSIDGGNTFSTINPTTIFPENLFGGFCCDQIIQYVPSIERFVWLLQYSQVNKIGPNAYRLATASPQDIINSKCTSWTYWDLTSTTFGIGTNWMDYPDLSVGDNFLYMSADVVGSGLFITRIPLNEIRTGSTINFQFTNASSGDIGFDGRRTSYGGHISQNTGNEAFWSGHVDNGTMQIFRWHESSTSYSWRNLDVNNWPQNTITSTNPNGNDWLNKLSGFPKHAVIGITRRNNELWMAWTASSGDGGHGGFKFPHPHVQVIKMDINNYHVIEQMQIWNPNHAFAYPCFATNSRNEVGITLGWGGGNTFNGNTAVGIMGDFVVWYRDGSTWSTNRWGDYVTARRSGTNDQLFGGFGFVTTGNSTANYAFEPFYVLFGRKSATGDGGIIK